MGNLELCELCTASKMHEIAVPMKTEIAEPAVGQQVFRDIQGSLEVSNMHGARYAI